MKSFLHFHLLNLLKDKSEPLSEDYIYENSKFNKYLVREALFDLKSAKVLEEFYLDDFDYVYYFKMLGERSN